MIHTNQRVIYSPDEWNSLTADIDRQSGAILPEICKGVPLTFTARKGVATAKGSQTQSCHCGNASKAVVPYEPAVPANKLDSVRQRGGGLVQICLVCDVAGAMPRFSDNVEFVPMDEDDGFAL